MLSSSATAKESRVKRNVKPNTRAGMPSQRGRDDSSFGIVLNYTSSPLFASSLNGAESPKPKAQNRKPVPIRYNTAMSQAASAITRSPAEIVQLSPVSQAANGICYARAGEVTIAENDLDRMIAAVPVRSEEHTSELQSPMYL